ncbi:hypothetical protein F511_37110 [Dorcoceras hygrometricum]|uniref:Uncharacterized protein n=1 Tax=Dorcoceras hygrometricum TaxID=472368 RepID=A0A2Z7ABD1_9LAMI|nr:hypothetical protein F511_37110 [Dorcoceras hygrometricum]
MEWAAGLAMETSKVESAVCNQARAKLNQLEHDEPAETMNQLQALKRNDEPAAIAKRCRLHELIRQRFALALKIQQEEFALLTSRKIQSQRKDFQTQCLLTQSQEDKSIIVKEDSGEAFDEPDASNSSIQSRAYMNQLLLLNQAQSIQSTKISAEDESSRGDIPVAKQLTIYE